MAGGAHSLWTQEAVGMTEPHMVHHVALAWPEGKGPRLASLEESRAST